MAINSTSPPAPLYWEAHIGNHVLCLLETVSRQLLSPSLAQLYILKLWLEAGVCPPFVLWIQIRHAVVTTSALPLCQVFQTDPMGGLDRSVGWTRWAGVPEENWSMPRADRNQQKPRGEVGCFSVGMKEGTAKGRKQEALLQLVRAAAVSWEASFLVLELINCAKNRSRTSYVGDPSGFVLYFYLPGAVPCAWVFVSLCLRFLLPQYNISATKDQAVSRFDRD